MKQKLTYYLPLLFLVLTGACRSTSAEEEVARELCQCFQEMTELYAQVQSQDESEGDAQLAALMEKLEAAAAASEECVEQVETDHGDLLDQKEEQIKEEMQKLCPKVVETLEAIDKGYE